MSAEPSMTAIPYNLPVNGKFQDPKLFKKQILNFLISNKNNEEMALGGMGGEGMGGASKVKCAEQVTTNICAIILV